MSFLNSLLLTLIKALHTFINNYALTIIVFTILIKLVVMPLNLKSRRSTMRMSTIQPKAAIQPPASAASKSAGPPSSINTGTRHTANTAITAIPHTKQACRKSSSSNACMLEISFIAS